jgi:hypothetical protein
MNVREAHLSWRSELGLMCLAVVPETDEGMFRMINAMHLHLQGRRFVMTEHVRYFELAAADVRVGDTVCVVKEHGFH